MKFIIIHGAYGNPNENWFPWLKEELEKLGHNVIVPKFPTPENQTLTNWMNIFEQHIDWIDSKTIFIGHSLAPSFILSVLEKIDIQIKACFFVAGFTGVLNHEIDVINKSFVDKKFNWEKIKSSCKSFYLYASDNDPYVPLKKGKELANNLNTNLEVINGAKHFNKDAGFNTFPKLLEDIKKLIL